MKTRRPGELEEKERMLLLQDKENTRGGSSRKDERGR